MLVGAGEWWPNQRLGDYSITLDLVNALPDTFDHDGFEFNKWIEVNLPRYSQRLDEAMLRVYLFMQKYIKGDKDDVYNGLLHYVNDRALPIWEGDGVGAKKKLEETKSEHKAWNNFEDAEELVREVKFGELSA